MRYVDTNKPLSYEDFRFLQDRGRLPRAYRLDPNDSRFSEADRSYAAPAEREAEASEIVDEDEASWEETAGEPIENRESDEDEASQWDNYTVDELKEELDRRDLPTSGNKDELIERLRDGND